MGKLIPSKHTRVNMKKKYAASVFIGTVVTNVGGSISYSPPKSFPHFSSFDDLNPSS